MIKFLGLLQCITLMFILTSPIIWIYLSFVPFIKFLGSMLIVYFVAYVFSEGFSRAMKDRDLESNKETSLRK